MSNLVRVYGFHRSGNNFLIQTLIKNFVFEEDIKTVIKSRSELDRFKKTFFLDEEVKGDYVPHLIKNETDSWVHPYGKLFGGHNKSKYDQRGIYIIRNPRDVMLSFWKLKGQKLLFEEWCTNELLNSWRDHILHFKRNDFFIIKYEDLRDRNDVVLKKISTYFGLEPKNNSFKKLEKLVGWAPPKGILEGKTRNKKDFSEIMNKRFESFVNFYENEL
ncbi:MAG: sulfotransferase domain-containing protein [Promethearchaeota archaeon]|jgi:hypothetical protein